MFRIMLALALVSTFALGLVIGTPSFRHDTDGNWCLATRNIKVCSFDIDEQRALELEQQRAFYQQLLDNRDRLNDIVNARR